jgi:hypothetical protein
VVHFRVFLAESIPMPQDEAKSSAEKLFLPDVVVDAIDRIYLSSNA